jgi:integrase
MAPLIEGMPRPRWLHLVPQITRHRKRVWYVRVGHGPRIRLRSPYGTPEFESEYHAAIRGEKAASAPRKPGAGTLRWLWDQYRDTSAWTTLSRATQRQQINIMSHVLETAGTMPLAEMTRAHIVAGRERRKDTPSQANNFLNTMRSLFKWAKESEHLAADPTEDVKIVPRPKTGGFRVWTEDEIERFEAHWQIGTRERLALDLLLYTGLRRGDVVRLGRQHVRDGEFRIRTEKNGVEVIAPILPPLARSIEATKTGDLSFICGDRGRPRTKESFGIWFRRACNAAGCPGSAHGLRKAGATRAAENGATTEQLKALFGWTDDAMPWLYAKSAERARLAREAASKLQKNKKRKSIPSPGQKVRDSALKQQ